MTKRVTAVAAVAGGVREARQAGLGGTTAAGE